MVLGEHGVFFGVQVHVFQFTVVHVLHGRVVQRHEFTVGQFDGISVDVQLSVQVIYVVGDVVVDDDLLDGGDFSGDFLGEFVGLTTCSLV